jgi:hypothetical protein
MKVLWNWVLNFCNTHCTVRMSFMYAGLNLITPGYYFLELSVYLSRCFLDIIFSIVQISFGENHYGA